MENDKNTSPRLASICVFCGSRVGTHPAYAEAARATGRLLAHHKIRVVFGGGRIGLMGEVAAIALANGTEVIGVIPDFLKTREIAMRGLTELIVVPDMHMRKRRFLELSDAFMMLPGGIGTLEEMTEVFSWYSMALHTKPLGILNVRGYYDPFIQMLQQAVDNGFMDEALLEDLYVNDDVDALLKALQQHIHSLTANSHLT